MAEVAEQKIEVISGKKTEPRRIIATGVHGVGKSTFAASAPNPIFIECKDEGLNDIGPDRLPITETWQDVLNRFEWVHENDRTHKTLVVDHLSGLEEIIFAQVAKDKGVDHIEEVSKYKTGYEFALKYWDQFIAGLDWIRRDRKMHIILVAHSNVIRFEDPEQESYDRWSLSIHKKAAAKIGKWADEILFASYKVFVKTSEENFKKRNRGVGTGDRVIYTTERPSHVAKNRLGLPDELPLLKENGWSVLAPYLNGKTNGKEKANG